MVEEGLRFESVVGGFEVVTEDLRRRFVREGLGEMVGEEEDLVGVKVDAARRFANDPLFKIAGLMGEFVPIRRLAMDAVND